MFDAFRRHDSKTLGSTTTKPLTNRMKYFAAEPRQKIKLLHELQTAINLRGDKLRVLVVILFACRSEVCQSEVSLQNRAEIPATAAKASVRRARAIRAGPNWVSCVSLPTTMTAEEEEVAQPSNRQEVIRLPPLLPWPTQQKMISFVYL